jgi:hypothetical protein
LERSIFKGILQESDYYSLFTVAVFGMEDSTIPFQRKGSYIGTFWRGKKISSPSSWFLFLREVQENGRACRHYQVCAIEKDVKEKKMKHG